MIKIKNFPELRQNSYYECGANAVQSVLAYFGYDLNGRDVKKITKTNKKMGTPIKGIEKIAKMYRIRTKSGPLELKDLKKNIKNGNPVILLLQAWSNKKDVNWVTSWKNGHYAVAIGYDKNRIYFEDPSSVKRTYLNFKELEKRWHGIGDKGEELINFGIIFYKKKSNNLSKRAIHMR